MAPALVASPGLGLRGQAGDIGPKIKLTNKARIHAPDPSGTRAEHVLADLYKGGDPEGARRASTTLREALEDYVKVKNLRARSIRDYRHKVETYLSAWLDCPLQEITGEMVKVRHRDIAAEIEKRHRAAVKATAERYSAWAQQAEARGWLEAAARHRAAAAAAEVGRLPSGQPTAGAGIRVSWHGTPRCCLHSGRFRG